MGGQSQVFIYGIHQCDRDTSARRAVTVHGLRTHIHEGSIDVVAGLAVDRDEERQAAVGGQHIHAAVLVMVAWQQPHTAVLRADPRSHNVQRLDEKRDREGERDGGRERERVYGKNEREREGRK